MVSLKSFYCNNFPKLSDVEESFRLMSEDFGSFYIELIWEDRGFKIHQIITTKGILDMTPEEYYNKYIKCQRSVLDDLP